MDHLKLLVLFMVVSLVFWLALALPARGEKVVLDETVSQALAEKSEGVCDSLTVRGDRQVCHMAVSDWQYRECANGGARKQSGTGSCTGGCNMYHSIRTSLFIASVLVVAAAAAYHARKSKRYGIWFIAAVDLVILSRIWLDILLICVMTSDKCPILG